MREHENARKTLDELDYSKAEIRDVAILLVNALGVHDKAAADVLVERVLRKVVETGVARAHPKLVAALERQRVLAERMLQHIDKDLTEMKERYGAHLEASDEVHTQGV